MSTIVEMRVHMDCPGCERTIKKALQKLDGVNDVDIDMAMQKVIVTGWADQQKVLKAVRKTGRRAELWPLPFHYGHAYDNYHAFTHYYNYYQPQHIDYRRQNHSATSYAYYQPALSSSYDYNCDDELGYNYDRGRYDYHPQQAYFPVFDERASAIFSDDNPHACSIM
ncbi:heavy metal-associated isoprenylated plant protein 28-like [Malania oleifera]|uniref:heavy metal-associated isoprenylated plant protein 28-like n=1 Tax=Malania oleifera TaxID=397392 RepID=UPI0025AE2A14|nr:heavy metal-associated isoprenylated plant protein 28-like [Malania oleifera]